MVKRVVIYGWAVPVDRVYGPGSGALIDLTYFVDDEVSISDVIGIIQHAGYKLIPKRIGNRRTAPVESDKVTVEDWENRLASVTVGSEKVQTPEEYGRYTYPGREI